jgi:predicted ester cyclase
MKKVLLMLVVVSTSMMVGCNNVAEQPAVVKDNTDSIKAAKLEHNKATAMASIEGVNAHNVDQVLKDAAPDVTDFGDGSMKSTKGVDSLKPGIQGWLTAFPDVHGSNLTAVADGDWVIVWGDWTGTFKADFNGMKATGKSYKYKDADIFKFNDEGKITEHHSIQSPITMMTMIGAKMK